MINHQCQKYQRQGRDVNNTGQESGQQQHNQNFKEQYHKGRQQRINGGKQSRVIHGKVTETGIMLRMSAGAKQDFAMSVSVKAA